MTVGQHFKEFYETWRAIEESELADLPPDKCAGLRSAHVSDHLNRSAEDGLDFEMTFEEFEKSMADGLGKTGTEFLRGLQAELRGIVNEWRERKKRLAFMHSAEFWSNARVGGPGC